MPSDDLTRDTIAAIATPAGRGGIGDSARFRPGRAAGCGRGCWASFRSRGWRPSAHFATGSGETIDQGLALYFPAPHSYTGERCSSCRATAGRW